jgi:hypothetical protein
MPPVPPPDSGQDTASSSSSISSSASASSSSSSSSSSSALPPRHNYDNNLYISPSSISNCIDIPFTNSTATHSSSSPSGSLYLASFAIMKHVKPLSTMLLQLQNVTIDTVTPNWRYALLLSTSRVTRHTSHITRHTSHVTRHTSHVTHDAPSDARPSPSLAPSSQDPAFKGGRSAMKRSLLCSWWIPSEKLGEFVRPKRVWDIPMRISSDQLILHPLVCRRTRACSQ